jgi:hypothetical protein
MALSDKKQKVIFDYYTENGFNHSTEQIVNKLDICHKTFFNRYGSKVKSIEIAWKYWQGVCQKKWESLMECCNHSVEELAMTVYNIYKLRFENPHYYNYTRDHRKYLETDSFFYSALQYALKRGKQSYHIHESLNSKSYIIFLLNNMFLIDSEHYNKSEVLKYVLQPALTERGMELFLEIPFAS